MDQSGVLNPLLFDAAIGRTSWPHALDHIAARFSAIGAAIASRDDIPSVKACSTSLKESALPLGALGERRDSLQSDFVGQCAGHDRRNWPCCMTALSAADGLTQILDIYFQVTGQSWRLSLYREAQRIVSHSVV